MSRYGHNVGFIDELYRSYLSDPESVSEAWRDFFHDYRPESPGPPEAAAGSAASSAPRPDRPAAPPVGEAEPLRGAAARIVENMAASLGVPTATSVRTIPVKLLEENRRVINGHQRTMAGNKVSFTHLIGWAVARALEAHPAMNVAFLEQDDGTPAILRRDRVNLGVAIDVERRGRRGLVVPNVKDATSLDFPSFLSAHDDLVRRARTGALTVDDLQETTATLTNPGMLGTGMSVPRLMRDQGTIIGVGSIGFPVEYSAMAPDLISELGLSKVMTVTSTYDHRVIQGAESGQFLLTLERLLLGEEEFYDRIFHELGVAQKPMRRASDRSPRALGGSENTEAIAKQAGVLQLIRSYRVRGHLWADLDPLRYAPEPTDDLEMSTYGLTIWDLDRPFIAGGLGGQRGTLPLRQILDILRRTYCGRVGVEFMHIQDTASRHWLQDRLEHLEERPPLSREDQQRILRMLNVAEAFETFLHTSYVGQKRFSLEGGETLIPMLDALLRSAGESGIEQVVMGMAHRGRLNVLAHVVGKPYGRIFAEFEESDPQSVLGSGDVKYHLGAAGEYDVGDGRTIRVTLASNPSHLEAVDPVVQGMARARQDRLNDSGRGRALPLLIHGDASFAGQGVVAETLNLSLLRGFRTGGTVHIVVNNQIGFTTDPSEARSSQYPTDVAKMVGAPIFHVNGDDPEEAVRVIRLALAFRQEFARDVVVDLFCYRRWGHNEADDPSFTNPRLYAEIRNHRSVRKLYTERLLRRGDLDAETAERALDEYREHLRHVHDEVRETESAAEPSTEPPVCGDLEPAPAREVDTAVDEAPLRRVLDAATRTPEGFRIHSKLERMRSRRREMFEDDRIDWALAEALAFGSLLVEERSVRMSGQDSARGTFNQRHAVLHDQQDGHEIAPLAELETGSATFQVHDSLLSEFAVLGFEFGYSVEHGDALVLWEAQFGDFANGAQVIIDQFVAGAEEKWDQESGLVLLLPHGYEGQGPEHSSARIERYLQLAARGNLRVAQPSTPAQYFHLLRRQARLSPRKPLVVMTPKSLLRHPDAVSPREALTGGGYRVILADAEKPTGPVGRVLFCSGKLAYDLEARRRASGVEGVAIHRIEQLYPFPLRETADLIRQAGEGAEVIWVQEEPCNMGAWDYAGGRIGEAMASGGPRYVGRPRHGSPATGHSRQHRADQEVLVAAALGIDAGVSSPST